RAARRAVLRAFRQWRGSADPRPGCPLAAGSRGAAPRRGGPRRRRLRRRAEDRRIIPLRDGSAARFRRTSYTGRVDALYAGARRIAVIVAGCVLLVVGIALLVLPGTGVAPVAAGLALLGAPFPWVRLS